MRCYYSIWDIFREFRVSKKIIHRKQIIYYGSHFIFDQFVKFYPHEIYPVYGMRTTLKQMKDVPFIWLSIELFKMNQD